MNFGKETETLEFKKSTGEMKEDIEDSKNRSESVGFSSGKRIYRENRIKTNPELENTEINRTGLST